MTVIIAPEAVDDLVAAADYIHARNPKAATKLVERVMRAIRRLDEGAFDGPEHSLKSGERVRSWPVPPLRVYYQRVAQHLIVLRIYHQARKPIVRARRRPRKR